MEHGAHAAVPNDTLRGAVMAATNNAGVDLVFDPVGGTLFDAALRTVKPFGRIVTLGFASGNVPQVPANLLLVKNISVIGHNMGLYYGWSPRDERVQHEPKMRAMMKELFQLAATGKLRAAQGKVIIRIKEPA